MQSTSIFYRRIFRSASGNFKNLEARFSLVQKVHLSLWNRLFPEQDEKQLLWAQLSWSKHCRQDRIDFTQKILMSGMCDVFSHRTARFASTQSKIFTAPKIKCCGKQCGESMAENNSIFCRRISIQAMCGCMAFTLFCIVCLQPLFTSVLKKTRCAFATQQVYQHRGRMDKFSCQRT
jgi:hypothetical protein